jgi:hypothetical protein
VADNDGEAAGIDPGALYTFKQAAALVLNPFTGLPLSVTTLHAWRQQGRLQVTAGTVRGRSCCLVKGSDLLEALAAGRKGPRRRGRTTPNWAGRRQIFRALVALQDEGESVLASRAQVARRFRVPVPLVQEIEEEGLAKGWFLG